jgi:hypothetical protein
MKGKVLGIAAGLALLFGLLLAAGSASAQATTTPIAATYEFCRSIGLPERDWTDSDGIRHVRGQKYQCNIGGDVDGREVGSEDFELDPAERQAYTRYYYTFTGEVLNQPVTGVGHGTGECNRMNQVMLCTIENTVHLSDGSLLKSSSTYQPNKYPQPIAGILLDPPGGDSRQGPRPRR